jgi:hypothetical protein
MKILIHAFVSWIPLGVAIVGLSATLYVAVQQEYRQSFNDPQIQMAEDAVYYSAHGASISDIVASIPIDIGKSLAPFSIVYNKDHKPVAYSGTLNGVVPVPPPGVFSYVDSTGSNRLTWQPQSGVRIAIDVERLSDHSGYVLAGRNMREVEKRELSLEWLVGFCMSVVLVTTLMLQVCGTLVSRRYGYIAK